MTATALGVLLGFALGFSMCGLARSLVSLRAALRRARLAAAERELQQAGHVTCVTRGGGRRSAEETTAGLTSAGTETER